MICGWRKASCRPCWKVFEIRGSLRFRLRSTSRIRIAPGKKRGLTQGEWRRGRLHVQHVIDDRVRTLFPTFYAGGGSTAYDRNKLLELGGFDSLMEPFYLEDADISYMAWKRGWFVFYEPRSVVYHEHRGTIGKHFSETEIQKALQQNNLLFTWKNIHEWKRLAGHFVSLYARLWLRLVVGPTPVRPSPQALRAAFRRFGAGSAISRSRAAAGVNRRYRSLPKAVGWIFSRPLR